MHALRGCERHTRIHLAIFFHKTIVQHMSSRVHQIFVAHFRNCEAFFVAVQFVTLRVHNVATFKTVIRRAAVKRSRSLRHNCTGQMHPTTQCNK